MHPFLNTTTVLRAGFKLDRTVKAIAISSCLALCLQGGAALAQTKQASDIKLGMVLPLTGPLAGTGSDIALGTQAMINEANAAGGIKGRRIDLMIEDDQFDANKSEALASDLIKNKGAIGLLSCFGTVSCLAVAKVAQEKGVPLLGPIAGTPALREGSNNKVYSVRANANEEMGALLKYLSGTGQNNVVVIAQEDAFGKTYSAALETAAKNYRFTPSQTIRFDPKAAKYTEIIKQLPAIKPPSAVILIASTAHSLGLIKALNEAKFYGQVLNLAGQANAGFVKGITSMNQLAVFATVTPSPFASHPTAIEYRAAWLALTGNENYSYLGFEAYLNARIIVEALKRAGTLNASGLDAALSQLNGLNISGLSYTFAGKQRQAASYTDLAMLSKGQFRH